MIEKNILSSYEFISKACLKNLKAINLMKKNIDDITISILGDSFKLDKTRIAHWERFVPYLNNNDFFKNYFHINKITKGSDSLSKRIRFWSMHQTASKIIKKFPNYNVAECGCFNGCSTYIIAKILEKNNFKNHFYVFDSFEGISKPSFEDLDYKNRSPKQGIFKADEEKFINLFKEYNFIDIKKGWIPERFKEVEEKKFSFVNIDVDIYEPTKRSLEFFFPRLVEGGCIHFDDYNFREWPGNKKAIKEFEEINKFSFSYEVPLGGYYIIK